MERTGLDVTWRVPPNRSGSPSLLRSSTSAPTTRPSSVSWMDGKALSPRRALHVELLDRSLTAGRHSEADALQAEVAAKQSRSDGPQPEAPDPVVVQSHGEYSLALAIIVSGGFPH